MRVKSRNLFKYWIPEWLIKIILFSLLMPSLTLFFLPMANPNAAAGHYGCEPLDIQFAVGLFYMGFVGFYSLERRFFAYLAAKEYFIIFHLVQIITCVLLFNFENLWFLYPIRFIQGMLFAGAVNLSISSIFSRLKTAQAREISFSVFYGMLICTTPFNNIVTADLIDQFDFNFLYKVAAIAFLPGLFLIVITMNATRRKVHFPLYNLDWASFVLYSSILIALGYMMIYGQQLYWFTDSRIQMATAIAMLCGILFVVRQSYLRRPYINLEVFRFRNFKFGLLIIFVLYICRFASGITNTYFANTLHFDPRHISYINIFNLMGLMMGVVVSCALVLQKMPIRRMWISGFISLLAFHGSMYYLFNVAANEQHYFLPLFLQGFGVGLIMVPTIIFIIASVDVKLGPSAAAVALAFRYFGYIGSIALINYFSLYRKGLHFNRFQHQIISSNPLVKEELATFSGNLMQRGMEHGKAVKVGYKLLVNQVHQQAELRYAMDYYLLMSILIVIMILIIITMPFVNKTILYLKSKTLSPA
ncbi:transporter [Sphingobacteriaceae bacterium WQ 2009]|uniref:Transporter n=1 Tax=Rhinopithecimicrobium faecis TaxID=2820698 RepID=A0A8T4HGH8_9SPHI|nr:transporter [Sphingobacteriaceae bacterium WQ 2009]